MSPESLTSLAKVREALNRVPCQLTPLFFSLIGNGLNLPHSCKPAGRLNFGPEDSDFPGLGKRLSPFHTSKLPSLESLQRLLINDLHAARRQGDDDGKSVRYIDDAQIDAEANTQDGDINLLTTLTNDSRTTSGTVLAFPSPSLDEICGDTKVAYDDVLRETMTMATVLPAETLLSLQHSNEGATFTTLLSGSVAWIIWPPSKHNLDVLQSSYQTFSEEFDSTKMNVSSRLQGGVCLVPGPGAAIRIPPFCPFMCLALETSVLATYSVVTASQLGKMLSKLPLLLAWFKTEIDGENKMKDFAAALIPHLSTILKGGFEKNELRNFKYPYSPEGPLRSLLHSWDDIKYAVASILSPQEAEQLIVMWDEFLREAKGRACWICGKYISSKLREMRKHFETKHWPTKKAVGDAKTQYQPLQTTIDTTVASTVSEEISEDSFHDAMEAIEPQDNRASGHSDEVVDVPNEAQVTDTGDEVEPVKGSETPV